MSVEVMLSRAVLEDAFTPVLHRIAGEQDAFARKTAGMNMGGNILIGIGSALVGFAVKSTEVAGTFDSIKKAMIATVGAQQAAFDTKYVDNFAQHSSQTYMDLSKAAGKLDAQHVSVSGHLQDMADIAAGTGASVGELSQIYDRLLAGGKTGTALGQQGFPRFGFSTKEIFEEAGLAYKPGQKVQGMITPEQADAAIHKLIRKKGWHGLDEKNATTTIKGASGMMHDAMDRFEKGVGDANLGSTIKLLNTLAGGINAVATAIENHPSLTKGIEVGAGIAIAGGGVMKGMAAWRDYKTLLGAVKIAGEAERAGEGQKPGIAKKEGDAVKDVAGKYGGLRGMLLKVGTATLGANAETVGMSRVMLAGIGTIGLYGIAFAGLVYDIKLVIDSFQELNKASRDAEAAMAAVNKARSQGYDLKDNAGKATGYNALPVWKQYGEELVNGIAGGQVFDTTNGGFDPLTDAHSRALAKKHGMPKNGIKSTMIREAKAKAEAAAQARRDAAKAAAKAVAAAAGDAANKYELDPALSFKMKQDERRIEMLKAMGGHEKELKAARAQEIADLNTAAGLLEKQARLASDIGKKYALMDQAADDRQKAKLMALDKGDKQSGLDKLVAKIFGGGGLGEDDILKRTGVGRSFFAGMKGGKAPVSPLHAALAALAKRPFVLNLHMGDKPFAQIKADIKDDTLSDLARLMEGSSLSKIYR